MDVQAVWLVVLAVATPLAGVVGFALQLRQVKQTQLENEKLRLEIAALRSAHSERESLVRVATMAEVMRFRDDADTRLSRREPDAYFSVADDADDGDSADATEQPRPLRARLHTAGGYLLLAVFLGYLAYDLYRLGRWLWALV